MTKFKYKLKKEVFLYLVTMFENSDNFKYRNISGFVKSCVLAEMREKLLQKAAIYKDEYTVSWKPHEAVVFFELYNPLIEYLEPYYANSIQAMNMEIHRQVIAHYNLSVQ